MNMIKNGYIGKLKWAVAVAAVAVIVILAGIIPRIGGTGLAFAQVVQRIQQIQTVTFQTMMTLPPGERGRVDTYQHFYKAPHLGRQEWTPSGVVTIIDTQARKILHCFPETKTYFYRENIDPRFRINMLDRIAEIKAGTIETLPEKELAGHKVAGFKAPLPNGSAIMATIWADVETGNPVQVEFKHPSGSTHVWSDFQFNVPLDDALFSLTPPEGYTFKAE